MKKERWKRIPIAIIRQHDELIKEMRDKRKNYGPCWPYLCGNVIKWKYGKGV